MKFRIVLVLLLLSVSTLSAQTNQLNSKISFTYQGNSFEKILQIFEEKTNCFFQYDATLKPSKKWFVLKVENEIAKDALRDFLQNYGLDFSVVGDQSLVLKKWIAPKEEVILSGRVYHAETKERLVNAFITIPQTGQSSFTNDQGIFQIRTDGGFIIYGITYPGFLPFIDTIENFNRTYFLDIPLVPEMEQMEVTLVTTELSGNSPKVVLGKSDEFNINRIQLEKIPQLMGEPDILRVMSLNPGVVSGSEGVFGMYVRGGSSDQNLVLLDDVPIYNPYHLYGVFGVFNSDIVKNAKFYRGVFPADKGGRLSSVIDVNTKEGNPNKLSGSINLGILTSRIALNGPLFNKKTTFSLAFRRSIFDYLVQPLFQLIEYKSDNFLNRYYFYDLNFKLTHRFSAKSRLSASVFGGLDYAGLVDRKFSSLSQTRTQALRSEDASSWGNQVANLSWDYMPSATSSFSLKSYVTNYSYSHSHLYSNEISHYNDIVSSEKSNYVLSNGLRDIEFSAHYQKQLTQRLNIKIGTGFIGHEFVPNKRILTSETDSVQSSFKFQDNEVFTPEVFGYLSSEYHHPKLGYFDFGIRGVYYGLELGQYYVLPEPRFSIRMPFSNDFWFKVSGSQTRQFFHQLNNLTLGLPSDLWVPSNAKFSPSKATQGAIGITKEFSRWVLSMELFYKRFDNILEYNDNAVYVTSGQNWEKSVCTGTGESKGFEVLLEKKVGKLNGWISYTLMQATRQFDALNQGKEFAARYDRRHNFNILVNYKISNKMFLSATWVYNSGFAYTLPVGIIPSQSSNDPFRDVYIYGTRNNRRTESNHRLDLSMNIKGKPGKLQTQFSFGIYNVYNQHNPFFINLALDQNGDRKLYQVSLLPIIPFVSYQLSF